MRTVAVIQARMTSTRLPGKILEDLEGAPLLAREVERLRHASRIDGITIATTTNATDDQVVQLAARIGVGCFRGDEHDVLSRYVGAAAETKADVVVRITADCPLIDGEIVDRVVHALGAGEYDYASNVVSRTYPRGLDVEAFTRDTLTRVASMATSRPAREHVTWFIHRERPELFRQTGVEAEQDASDLRWTVDTPEDLAMVRAIYAGLDLGRRHAPYAEVLAWVRAHPEVADMNAGVKQKTT